MARHSRIDLKYGEEMSHNYATKRKHNHHAEPLMPLIFPERPCMAQQLLTFRGLLFKIAKLTTIPHLPRSSSMHLKSILESLKLCSQITDQVTDLSLKVIKGVFYTFSQEYNCSHKTSSPRYPQANGAAERAVKTIKALLDKTLILIRYQSTPLANRYSPAQLLMAIQMSLHDIASVPLNPPTLPKQKALQDMEEDGQKINSIGPLIQSSCKHAKESGY